MNDGIKEVAKTAGKAIDGTRDLGGFIAKYTGSSLEQAIGIFEDRLKYMRWERQVRLIERAQDFLQERGLEKPSRQIPLKIAIPLLQAGSLEEYDDLQDLWARMLANAADAESEVEVVPSFVRILEQMSPTDAALMNQLYSAAHASRVCVMRWHVQEQKCEAKPEVGELSFSEEEILVAVENLIWLGCLVRVPLRFGGHGLNEVRTTALGLVFHKACSPANKRMNTQIKAIERIVDSQERNCAVVFFLFFSRFEYALKRAGYVTRRKNSTVEADWNQFAGRHPELMQKALEDKEYSKAFKLVQTNPPKKQIVNEKGQLNWQDDNHDQKFNLARAVTLLKRIRNNLFHGGKFPEGPRDDISRDRELLNAGLLIMQACLDGDRRLLKYFIDSLE